MLRWKDTVLSSFVATAVSWAATILGAASGALALQLLDNWLWRIIQQISLCPMAIALSDFLDERQVVPRLRSRKLPNALREIIEVLAQNRKIDNAERFL